VARKAKLLPSDTLVYMFIENFWRVNYYSPTVREIVDGVGLSSTSVANYSVQKLKKRGLLRDTKCRAVRTLVPTNLILHFGPYGGDGRRIIDT